MSTSSRSSAVGNYELAHHARPSAVDQSAAQQQFSYLAYAREDAPHANFSGSSSMAQVGHSSSNIDLHQDSNGSSYTGNQQQMLHGAGGSGSSMSSSARRLREFIPEHKKDHEYWLKRQKNNEAAKRSREKRRINDIVMGRKIFELSNENKRLRLELEAIKRHFGLPVNMPYPIGDLASLQNNQPDSPSLVNVSSSDDSSPSLSSFVHTPVGYSALSPLPSMSELRGGIIQETGNVTLTPSLETNQPERMLINSGESLSRSQIYSQQQQQQQQQLQQQQHHVQSLWQHRQQQGQQQQGQQQQHLRSNRAMSLDGIRPGNSGDSDPGIMLGGAPLHSGTPVTQNSSTSTTFPYKKSLQGVLTQGVPLHNNRLHDIPLFTSNDLNHEFDEQTKEFIRSNKKLNLQMLQVTGRWSPQTDIEITTKVTTGSLSIARLKLIRRMVARCQGFQKTHHWRCPMCLLTMKMKKMCIVAMLNFDTRMVLWICRGKWRPQLISCRFKARGGTAIHCLFKADCDLLSKKLWIDGTCLNLLHLLLDLQLNLNIQLPLQSQLHQNLSVLERECYLSLYSRVHIQHQLIHYLHYLPFRKCQHQNHILLCCCWGPLLLDLSKVQILISIRTIICLIVLQT